MLAIHSLIALSVRGLTCFGGCAAALLAVSFAACGGGPQHPGASGPRGARGAAAAYEVREFAVRLAQIVVWSEGAHPTVDRHGAVIHIGARIENEGEAPLSFDAAALSLEAYDDAGYPMPAPEYVSIEPVGDEAIPAGSVRSYDMFFVVKPDRLPAEIGSLRLRWAVVCADGRRFVQPTEFAEDEEGSHGDVRGYVPIAGFYDPYLTPPHDRAAPHHVRVRRTAIPARRPPQLGIEGSPPASGVRAREETEP